MSDLRSAELVRDELEKGRLERVKRMNTGALVLSWALFAILVALGAYMTATRDNALQLPSALVVAASTLVTFNLVGSGRLSRNGGYLIILGLAVVSVGSFYAYYSPSSDATGYQLPIAGWLSAAGGVAIAFFAPNQFSTLPAQSYEYALAGVQKALSVYRLALKSGSGGNGELNDVGSAVRGAISGLQTVGVDGASRIEAASAMESSLKRTRASAIHSVGHKGGYWGSFSVLGNTPDPTLSAQLPPAALHEGYQLSAVADAHGRSIMAAVERSGGSFLLRRIFASHMSGVIAQPTLIARFAITYANRLKGRSPIWAVSELMRFGGCLAYESAQEWVKLLGDLDATLRVQAVNDQDFSLPEASEVARRYPLAMPSGHVGGFAIAGMEQVATGGMTSPNRGPAFDFLSHLDTSVTRDAERVLPSTGPSNLSSAGRFERIAARSIILGSAVPGPIDQALLHKGLRSSVHDSSGVMWTKYRASIFSPAGFTASKSGFISSGDGLDQSGGLAVFAATQLILQSNDPGHTKGLILGSG